MLTYEIYSYINVFCDPLVPLIEDSIVHAWHTTTEKHTHTKTNQKSNYKSAFKRSSQNTLYCFNLEHLLKLCFYSPARG